MFVILLSAPLSEQNGDNQEDEKKKKKKKKSHRKKLEGDCEKVHNKRIDGEDSGSDHVPPAQVRPIHYVTASILTVLLHYCLSCPSPVTDTKKFFGPQGISQQHWDWRGAQGSGDGYT